MIYPLIKSPLDTYGTKLIDSNIDEQGMRWLTWSVSGRQDYVMCIHDKTYQELLKYEKVA